VPATDFDFLLGPWLIDNVRRRGEVESFLGEGSGITKHMGGLVNTDVTTFRPPPPGSSFTGMSLRLLDPATDEWSIYWINDSTVQLSDPVRGRFDGNAGEFRSPPTSDDPQLWRFLWTGTDTATPHWEQDYSEDGGATWTVDWTMDFRRP